MKRKIIAGFAALALATGVAYATTQNFPDGYNNLPNTHWMRGRDKLTMPVPHRDYQWFDDFFRYTAGDWVVTEVSDSTQAMGDGNGGELVLTTLTTEDDAAHLQSVGEIFTLASGKEAYFETRLHIGEITQSDFVVGLQVRDTTPLAVADGVYFQKDDGDALLDFHSMSGSADTASTGIHTMVASTYVKLAFYYDGGTNFIVAVDDVHVATVTATPTAVEMTVSFGVQAGATGAEVLTMDYIHIWRER